MDPILVFDDVLPDPHGYRAEALGLEYRDVTIGPDTFRGIAQVHGSLLEGAACGLLGDPQGYFTPIVALSFFRRSPAGQPEPNYIHSDDGMGLWTGIYYLNPTPLLGDGTHFWERTASGAIGGAWDAETQAAARDLSLWRLRRRVEAKFNRLLVFKSDLFHSRALLENYGTGDASRLTQVTFGGWA